MPVSASILLQGLRVRNPYTYEHSVRVAEYALLVSNVLTGDINFVLDTYVAALLHDVGKLLTPECILHAPRKLSISEKALVDTHAENGANMLNDIGIHIREAVRLHHTCFVDMNTVNYSACIIKVCDVFDALTSDRAYKRSLSKKESLSIMMKGVGTEFHPIVLNAICATTINVRERNTG